MRLISILLLCGMLCAGLLFTANAFAACKGSEETAAAIRLYSELAEAEARDDIEGALKLLEKIEALKPPVASYEVLDRQSGAVSAVVRMLERHKRDDEAKTIRQRHKPLKAELDAVGAAWEAASKSPSEALKALEGMKIVGQERRIVYTAFVLPGAVYEYALSGDFARAEKTYAVFESKDFVNFSCEVNAFRQEALGHIIRLAGSSLHQKFPIASKYFGIFCEGAGRGVFSATDAAEAGEQFIGSLAHHNLPEEAEKEYAKLLALTPGNAGSRDERFRLRHFQSQAAQRLIDFWGRGEEPLKAGSAYEKLCAALSGDKAGEAYLIPAAKELARTTAKTAEQCNAILKTVRLPEIIFVDTDHSSIAMLGDKYVDADMLLLRQDYLALYSYTFAFAVREGRADLAETLYRQSAQWPLDEQAQSFREHMKPVK